MRAFKEEIVVLPSTHSVDVNHYQIFCEEAFTKLNEFERRLIYLRFWECLPIARVADRVGRTWNETNFAIDKTVEKIQLRFSQLKTELNLRKNSDDIS